MPPPIPERYSLEVRLGRDGDVEEWLASDQHLDRPVLVRVLGPDASPSRRRRFLDSVRAAAGVNHPHLASVFTAGEVEGGAYAVSEWAGGMTLSDRIASDETIDVDEFLPNAAGLASALAALHAEGVVHGAIDGRALFYAVAHPAKLGGFGRPARDHTAIDDVRSLASALEEALTGGPAGGAPPSEVVDGLSPTVDRALRRAQAGLMNAKALADELGSAPSPVSPAPEPPGWSRRLLLAAGGLVVAAVALVGLGRLFLVDSSAPIILPETTAPGAAPPLPTTTTTQAAGPEPAAPRPLPVSDLASFDPFGGGTENDDRLPNLLDGDPSTLWRTETYLDPLPLLKPGVGISFSVEGAPGEVELSGITSGVSYVLAWSEEEPDDPDLWEWVVRGNVTGGAVRLQVPEREGGHWLFWMTDLPQRGQDDHSAEIAEVRFLS